MTTVTYLIPAIHCMHCVNTVQTEVGELPGIRSVLANAETKKVEIVFEDPASEEKIKALLAEINFPAAD